MQSPPRKQPTQINFPRTPRNKKRGVFCRSFQPLVDAQSRILILGSMPGPEALRRREYYGYPGNHFWKIIFSLFEVRKPLTYTEKKELLRENHIAVWDVIKICSRNGASDSSIRKLQPNNIARLIKKHPQIRAIFLNGRTAESLYQKFFSTKVSIVAHYLPSTSPAHAALSLESKLKKWSVLKKYLANHNPWC